MIINLKDFYPIYTSDCFIEVSEEIALLLELLARKEHADHERRRVNKALYSLDAGVGIRRDIVFIALSPQAVYERKLSNQTLYTAIRHLPEKQARRIYGHFFLRMSKAAIARAEGVSVQSVRESIERGLKNIEKFMLNFS